MRIGPSSANGFALLAGALFPLGFAPFSLWAVPIVSLACLSYLLRRHPSFWLGWWFGLGQFGIGISWVYVSMTAHGGASPVLGSLMTLVFVAGLAVFPGLLGLAFRQWRSHWPTAFGQVTLLTALWCTLEALRSWLLTGFPWLLAGHSALDSPFAGWLPWIGAYGVGALIALSAGLIAIAPTGRGWLTLSALIALSGLLLPSNQTTPGAPLTVGLWQPMITQAEKWKPAFQGGIIRDHLRLGLPDSVNVIVWPETALPLTEREADTLLAGLESTLREQNQGLFTGILGQHAGRYTNRMIGLGAASGVYDKSRLVPFGEYVPLESVFRGLIGFFDLPMSVIIPGPMQDLLQWETVRFAPLICYEVAYAGLARSISADADVLVTISNDTWFGRSWGPDQHLEIARIRAAELEKPVIRATNDGLTASIDANGRIQDQLPRFEQALLVSTITPHSGQTAYALAGEAPLIVFLVLLLTLTRRISGQKRVDAD